MPICAAYCERTKVILAVRAAHLDAGDPAPAMGANCADAAMLRALRISYYPSWRQREQVRHLAADLPVDYSIDTVAVIGGVVLMAQCLTVPKIGSPNSSLLHAVPSVDV